MSGIGVMPPPVRCGSCRFWAPFNDRVGLCRRIAARPAERSDTVAHWPETFAEEGCGEGAPHSPGAALQTCAGCAYWMPDRPEGGLAPVDFNEQRHEWWEHAGRCVRHAPQPRPTPGLRLTWPATQGSDSCGEGAPRPA